MEARWAGTGPLDQGDIVARPPSPLRAVHKHAAALYADQRVDTKTPLQQLCRAIAERIEEPEAAEHLVASTQAAVFQAVKRKYGGKGGLLLQLWQGVLDRTEHLGDHPDRVRMPGAVIDQLRAELKAGDPTFARFDATLAQATSAASGSARDRLLGQAADALEAATDPKAAAATPGTPAGEQARAHLERVQDRWVQVYDAALGDTGSPSRKAMTVARRAARAGHAAQKSARALRTGLVFGSRGWGSRHVNMFLPKSDRWVAAVAVIETLAIANNGTAFDPAQILKRTHAYIRRELGVPDGTVDDTELLTQAGWTLMRVGRRHLAAQAAHAAWEAVRATDMSAKPRGRAVPDVLHDLSVQLAGFHYSHGDHHAARAILDEGVRDILDNPYPGDPDEGWGEVVNYNFYGRLILALDSPYDPVGPLRAEWLHSLGPGWSTAYPSKWALAGVTAELLATTGNAVAAATVAEVSRRLLERPLTLAQEQIRVHLSEMSDSTPPPPRAETEERVAALLAELVALVVAEPDAVDYKSRRTIEGLSELTKPTYRRIGAAIDADTDVA
jgi:hypothetical protein